MPADERALFWLGPAVEPADQQRRLAEDHLFVCEDGFGCCPTCSGNKVFGRFLSNISEFCVIHRGDVEEVIENHPQEVKPKA